MNGGRNGSPRTLEPSLDLPFPIPDSRPSARRRWLTPAAAVFSGLLFALAFPPIEWTLLLPLALVPWLLALAAEPSRTRALVSGFLFGLAFWCASIPWIVYVVTTYGGQSRALGIVSLVLLATILAEWPALVAWGAALWAPPGSWKRLAVFPLLWVASEHARSFIYGGFPWNLTAFALYRRPVWIQSAVVWGVFGVGFLVALLSALVALSLLRRRPGGALLAALVVAATWIWGTSRLEEPAPQGDKELSVLLLQPNVTQESRLAPGGAAEVYRQVLEQVREAVRRRPALIVVPESAFPLYWQRSASLRADLSDAARSCGCAILFNDVDFTEAGRYYNAARLVTPSGLADSTYRKLHLVPFGEYVPLPKLFFFARQVSTEIGEFSAARESVVLRASPFSIGMGVCYEILYPSLARDETARGANLLATISNDSWYGKAGAQEQHLSGALLRAVENGRSLVRAAITGISASIDSKGRVRGELPPGAAGILEARVRLSSELTAWTRWGFWLPRAADVAALAVLVFGVVRWIRSRSAS